LTMALIHAVSSKSLSEARYHVIRLYRSICRSVPFILHEYDLVNANRRTAMQLIGNEFRKNADIRDPHIIDIMRFKAEMEFDETIRLHKTSHHVAALVYPPDKLPIRDRTNRNHSPFLQNFFRGQLPT